MKPMETSKTVSGGHASGWNRAIACLILGALVYRTAYTVADPDLWGHVRFGLDILDTGRIVQEDQYSYLTTGQPWINHEWLAEVLFAALFRWAGVVGLVLLKVGVSLTMLGVLYRHLYRQGLDALQAGMILILVTLLYLPGLNTVRPQLVTYLCFLLLLLVLHAAEHGRPRWLVLLPVLVALWVNLHGGWLAGLAVLLAWTGVRVLRRPDDGGPSTRWLLIVVAVSLLATLLNPYGGRLPLFLLQTATVTRPEITEWAPLGLVTREGAMYVLLVAFAVFGLVAGERSPRPALLGAFLCVALMPLLAIRHLPLFAAGVVILTGEALAEAGRRFLPLDVPALLGRPRPWLVAVPLLAGVGLVLAALPRLTCIRIDPQTGFDFPARAVDLLRRSEAEGNLAVHFDWGEYVIWHLGPRVRVSVDGRRETLYSDAVYEENVRFRLGVGDWDALLRRPATDGALVSKRFAVFNLLKREPGWILLYEDPVCALFVRQGSVLERQVGASAPADWPADGAGLCFP